MQEGAPAFAGAPPLQTPGCVPSPHSTWQQGAGHKCQDPSRLKGAIRVVGCAGERRIRDATWRDGHGVNMDTDIEGGGVGGSRGEEREKEREEEREKEREKEKERKRECVCERE